MTKTLYSRDNQSIIYDDFLATMEIQNESVDLIITSPPYNLDISYNSHNDKMEYEEYLKFSKNRIKKCYDLAKDH
jgi:site-specific DNA-methyltransferase (adenine-specific)